MWNASVILLGLRPSVYFDELSNAEVQTLEWIADLGFQILLASWVGMSLMTKKAYFNFVAIIVGFKVDQSKARYGRVFFCNTGSRRDELFFSTITEIIFAGHLSQKDGERLRGSLQFDDAQVAGKCSVAAAPSATIPVQLSSPLGIGLAFPACSLPCH